MKMTKKLEVKNKNIRQRPKEKFTESVKVVYSLRKHFTEND